MKIIPWILFALATLGFQVGDSPTKSVDSAKSSSEKAASEKNKPRRQPEETATGAIGTQARRSDDDATLLTIIEEVEVPAKSEGVLEQIKVREGALVEAGSVLAKIDETDARLTFERATIEFDIAKAQAANDVKLRTAEKVADVAHSELRRALDSVAIRKNAVSEAEIDRLRLASDKADLEVLQAKHDQKTAGLTSRLKETEMKLARQALERRTISTPISGMVVQVMHQQGEWVTAGKTVFRVLRLDRLRVEGFVSVKRLKTDLVGHKAAVTVELPDDPAAEFAAEIVFVSPEVDPVNQTVRVWAEVDNAALQLRPGMRGKVKFQQATAN